jgi:hypothetical protein
MYSVDHSYPCFLSQRPFKRICSLSVSRYFNEPHRFVQEGGILLTTYDIVSKIVRIKIRSRIDFPPAESSRRIPESTRFLSQEFIHAEICMIV